MTVYEVESILDVDEGRQGQRLFLVKYLGYPIAEWEKEVNLIGCKDIVEEFLANLNDPEKDKSPIPWQDDDDIGEENEELYKDKSENEITMYQVMKYANRFKQMRGGTLEISQLGPKLSGKEQIYILLLEGHFYVLYDDPELHRTTICDGANASINKIGYFKDRLKEREIVPLEYMDQLGEDHCGSSAVCIALEFLAMHRTGKWTKAIHTSKGLRKYLIERLHKNTASAIHGWRPIRDNIMSTRCNNCGKQFKKRVQLSNHQRSCK